MKLKNTGNKVVSVGETILLPGETKEVFGYDDNTALEYLIGEGNLTIVKERAAASMKGK